MNSDVTDIGLLGRGRSLCRGLGVVGSSPCLDRPWKVVLIVGEIPGPRSHKQSRKREIKFARLLVGRDPCQVLHIEILVWKSNICFMTFIYWTRLLFWSQTGAQMTQWRPQPDSLPTTGFPSSQSVSADRSIANSFDIPAAAGPPIFFLFIWDLLAYPSCLLFEIPVPFIWIHWNQGGCWQAPAKIVGFECLEAQVQAEQYLPSMCVWMSEW